MAYKVAWYIEGRVLYVHGPDTLSLELIRQINDEAIRYLDTGMSRIHIIVDARSVRILPHNLVELRKVSRVMDHFLIGWITIIECLALELLRLCFTPLVRLCFIRKPHGMGLYTRKGTGISCIAA